jgi:protein SCO1/2
MRALTLAAALLSLASCGVAAEARPPTEDAFSVFDLDARFRDQAGRERTLASLGGRPQVIAMVYTRCAHTCPRILIELKRVEARLRPDERAGFTLVSLDPARDTPERLAQYAADVRLDSARWTLLTADENTVRETAAILGIRYRPESTGEYSHANAYLVLDSEGRVVHRETALGRGPGATVAALRAAR